MKLLLSSNSSLQGEPYLHFCKNKINNFLAENGVKQIVFIPFAAVTFGYDEYENKVINGLANKNIKIRSIHHFEDQQKAINEADAIMVGGGNSFQLLNKIYQNNLLEIIKKRVNNGIPYVGWSAGSNLACPTIKTTNDMPIVFPPSFEALNLIPFQINPHYIHGNPPGHNGETREQRILEFLEVNQKITVVGLREGSILEINKKSIQLFGEKEIRIFKYEQNFYELQVGNDLNFLMK